MKQLNKNPFLVGLAVVAVVLLGGLGFYASQAFSTFTEELDAYDRSVKTLHRLQNAVPYPSAENLAAARAAIGEYQAQLATLDAALRKHQPPLPQDKTPNQFQDELRREVSQVTTKAATDKVELPADFYLGFDEFKTGLPSTVVAPFLARQLAVFRWLADTLIDAGIKRIDLWQRLPLPVEKDEALAAFPENPTPEQLIRISPLVLSFTGEQARVRRALNDIFRSPNFFIVRSLEILNSNREAPLKSAVPGAEAPAGQAQAPQPSLSDLFGDASAAGEAPSASQDLPIVLGRETVTVRLRLEFLDFAPLAVETPVNSTQQP